MKFYLGLTDNSWFDFLSIRNPEDVNFWRPGGNSSFKVIPSGSPFLFKLKKPYMAVGGIGFFSNFITLPISVAWDTFQERNGAQNFNEFRSSIIRLRNQENAIETNPNIGCIVLTNPIFFKREDWIPVPDNWPKSGIQQGKSYSTDEPIGRKFWQEVERKLELYRFFNVPDENRNQLFLQEPEAQYGNSVLTKVRLGQGAFRTLVTEAYERRCTISGEKTLPVLEAAHIKQYVESGPHNISNGLLLRSDIHKLFDNYYLTITSDYKIEVSSRIKEEFENGKEYYRFHGKNLLVLPQREINKPNKNYIDCHNNKFKF